MALAGFVVILSRLARAIGRQAALPFRGRDTGTVLLLCLSGILFSGCAHRPISSADNLYAETYSGFGSEKRVFLAPMQMTLEAREADKGTVFDEIARQLEEGGWSVATTSDENYSETWSDIIRPIGGIYSSSTGRLDKDKYHFALSEFSKAVSRTGEYSAVIFPSLVLRNAELRGRSAYWDGVKRKVVAAGHFSMHMKWSGNTGGLSLELVVFDAGGAWMFTSYGGLVLPYYVQGAGLKPEVDIREDMFEEDRNIESGVRVALLPVWGRER